MGLFRKLQLTGKPDIDWEMTPEYTFGTYESWGGKERVRSKNERVYYFFIDAWDEVPKLCLMERGIKHARVVAEILAPTEMVQHCVNEQGKVAFFERTHPINEQLKKWLIANVIETVDDSKIIPLEMPVGQELGDPGLPGKDAVLTPVAVSLPHEPAEMSEEDVVALVAQYNFAEQERNPHGHFAHAFVDNGDNLTVSDGPDVATIRDRYHEQSIHAPGGGADQSRAVCRPFRLAHPLLGRGSFVTGGRKSGTRSVLAPLLLR